MSHADIPDRVRGTRTLGPDELARQGAVLRAIEGVLRQYDFPPVELPFLEHLDVYMDQMREEFRDRLFVLDDRSGRPLCLRPSVVTGAARLLLAKKGRQALPLRLSYCSPVFRYETIRKGNLRQFTHVGAEHLLPRDPLASLAEAIALTIDASRAAGLEGTSLVLSDVGVLRATVADLELPNAARSILLRHLMTPSDKLARYLPGGSADGKAAEEQLPAALFNAVEKLSEDELVELAQVLLATEADDAFQGRDQKEVARRMVRKLRRRSDRALYATAIRRLAAVQGIRGTVPSALSRLGNLEESPAGLYADRADEISRLMDYLGAYGIDEKSVKIDLGLIRAYGSYDGITFEAHHAGTGRSGPIAGGGQYDLGWVARRSEPIPGCGTALGLERVMMAVEAGDKAPAGRRPVDCLVATAGDVDAAVAVRTAKQLRDAGLSVHLELPSRSLKKELSVASSESIPFVVICGEAEDAKGKVKLRDMDARTDRVVAIEQAAKSIRRAIDKRIKEACR